ncbi:hypothetical protein ACFZAR_03690 [Streptomyces sp. NPDC008222]|uniref:hypothetical protein n=1 Tax=Streptomyces sp. NPDC008222 TaxID=3364820 RepID=UPI0036E4760B
MTACAFESATADGNKWATRPGCAITADGSYAARLALSGESWYPERWTLDGPEPYAVPLPGGQPEEPGTEVQPLADGRVLIHRLVTGRHLFSLLYPAGPGTGELPLGAVDDPGEGARLELLPPAPTGDRAFALAVGPRSTAVWLVAGGTAGPERLAELPGHCTGGVWLDRAGRMLALDRTQDGGPTKTVVVDLARGGEVSPLLQIADGSNDRLLLADPDSGLLLIRSDAPSPGRERLGWGVLGSTLPVRFPDCLRLDGPVTPFAIQPGQVLTPESCAVALRVDGAAGNWIGVWRPAHRRILYLAAPQGWLAGAGLWTREGELRLPFTTDAVRCGVARLEAPVPAVELPAREQGPVRPVPLQQAPLQRTSSRQASPQQAPLQRTPSQQAPSRQTPPHHPPTAQPPTTEPAPHPSVPHQPTPPPRPRKTPASAGITLRRTLTWPRPDPGDTTDTGRSRPPAAPLPTAEAPSALPGPAAVTTPDTTVVTTPVTTVTAAR